MAVVVVVGILLAAVGWYAFHHTNQRRRRVLSHRPRVTSQCYRRLAIRVQGGEKMDKQPEAGVAFTETSARARMAGSSSTL